MTQDSDCQASDYPQKSPQLEKDAKFWKNKGSRVTTLSERQYVKLAGEIAKAAAESDSEDGG